VGRLLDAAAALGLGIESDVTPDQRAVGRVLFDAEAHGRGGEHWTLVFVEDGDHHGDGHPFGRAVGQAGFVLRRDLKMDARVLLVIQGLEETGRGCIVNTNLRQRLV